MLVAENAREPSVHPDRDIQKGRDVPIGTVLAQPPAAGIRPHVTDMERARFAQGGEVFRSLGLEERGAVLERQTPRKVACFAVKARGLGGQAPKAHAVEAQHLGVELQDALDRPVPVRANDARELSERLRSDERAGTHGRRPERSECSATPPHPADEPAPHEIRPGRHVAGQARSMPTLEHYGSDQARSMPTLEHDGSGARVTTRRAQPGVS